MAIGLLTFVGLGAQTVAANHPAEVAGEILFALFMIVFGFILFRQKRPNSEPLWIEVLDDPHPWAEVLAGRYLRVSSSALIVLGFIFMFVAVTWMQTSQTPQMKVVGIIGWLVGWTSYISGCVNCARWKGRQALTGALGFLMLPGLVTLVCLSNRRKRLLRLPFEESRDDLIPIARRDRSFGFGYLLLSPSLVLILIISALALYRHSAETGWGEWKEVRSDSVGFCAMMPGEPLKEYKQETTRSGIAELNSYSVRNPATRDLFMIVATHLPQQLQNKPTQTFKLYNIGKLDILAAWPGATVRSEKYTPIGRLLYLDVVVIPPAGGIIKARIYATTTHYYKVFVQSAETGAESPDADKFFDSFQLLGGVFNIGEPVRGETMPGR